MPTKEAPTLFLDIDGVLNTGRGGLDAKKIQLLGFIIKLTGARIILSSKWRDFPRQLARINSVLEARGMKIDGVTPHHTKADGRVTIEEERHIEIQRWITENGKPARFIILDDLKDMGPLQAHLISTETKTGMTPEIAEAAIRKLNGHS
jgi:hypothetical protein